MGCTVSCAALETFSTFVEWAVKNASESNTVTHYFNDFLFIGRAGTMDCVNMLRPFQGLAANLGIPLTEGKNRPSTALIYLGIELDTIAGSSRLPRDKIEGL